MYTLYIILKKYYIIVYNIIYSILICRSPPFLGFEAISEMPIPTWSQSCGHMPSWHPQNLISSWDGTHKRWWFYHNGSNWFFKPTWGKTKHWKTMTPLSCMVFSPSGILQKTHVGYSSTYIPPSSIKKDDSVKPETNNNNSRVGLANAFTQILRWCWRLKAMQEP